MLKHKKGNLLDLAEAGEFDVIVHGCNCQNIMGSGIAKEIRERYPVAWMKDQKSKAGDPNKLGAFSWVKTKPGFIIVNAYTQYHYLPRGLDHFSYTGFENILEQLEMKFPTGNFGFPYIGMGLAGGDKNKIIPLLEDFATVIYYGGGTVTLVEYQP